MQQCLQQAYQCRLMLRPRRLLDSPHRDSSRVLEDSCARFRHRALADTGLLLRLEGSDPEKDCSKTGRVTMFVTLVGKGWHYTLTS